MFSSIHRFLIISILIMTLACAKKQVSETEILNAVIDAREIFLKNQRETNKGKWPVFDKDSINTEIAFLQSWSEQLATIHPDKLMDQERINFELLKHIIDDDLFLLKYQNYLFPLNSEGGFFTEIVYRSSGANLTTEENRNSYLERLKGIPDYLNHRTSLMREGISQGKTSPKIIVERCIELIEGNLAKDPNQSVFYLALNSADSLPKDYENQCLSLIANEIQPALEQFILFLKTEYLDAAKTEIGISSLPGGKEFYEQRIRFFTTLDMSPEDVFEKGQQEVNRIKSEMISVIESTSFKGSFADFLKFLRTDPQFYAKTPQELLNHASWLSKKMEGELPKLFDPLPRMPFTVKPVPAAIAPNYTGGRYSPGSYDDHRAGAYWVNTYKLESRPLYVLPSLTLHEAVPGHHLQNMLAAEIKDLPDFRSRTYLSAYGEGWGLYSEFLGIEANMYESPYENFGRLTYEMWRACRLVVDVGMHYKGWTRTQAIEFMAENTALSIHEVNTEIDRYIGWPGQAVSYKIGELKIRELRKLAETELADQFDIREFHNVILKDGSIPLFSLERNVRTFIAQKMSQAKKEEK